MGNNFTGGKTHMSPAMNGFTITPSDTVNFTNEARAIYVGVGGTIVLVTNAGDTITLVGVVTGTILPIMTKRINATSTTATTMVGLY